MDGQLSLTIQEARSDHISARDQRPCRCTCQCVAPLEQSDLCMHDTVERVSWLGKFVKRSGSAQQPCSHASPSYSCGDTNFPAIHSTQLAHIAVY